MTRKDFAARIYWRLKMRSLNESNRLVQGVFNEIRNLLIEGHTLYIPNFGEFKVKPHKFCTDKLKVILELSLIEFVAEIKGAATCTGNCSTAIDTGKDSKAKANIGSWLVLSEWEKNIRSDVQVFKVDGEKILPDTFYTLKGGLPVKVQEDEL